MTITEMLTHLSLHRHRGVECSRSLFSPSNSSVFLPFLVYGPPVKNWKQPHCPRQPPPSQPAVSHLSPTKIRWPVVVVVASVDAKVRGRAGWDRAVGHLEAVGGARQIGARRLPFRPGDTRSRGTKRSSKSSTDVRQTQSLVCMLERLRSELRRTKYPKPGISGCRRGGT